MLCSQLHLVKQAEFGVLVKPLPCRSWSCEYCAPKRRRQLMALAASGEPNRCLTLTVSTKVGSSPADRYQRLHTAWRTLHKRMLRQWALPPERRWPLLEQRHSKVDRAVILERTKTTPQKAYTRLHYMSFIEATKAGEPHLHILLRCPYIPVQWISEQMQDLLNSPVVWIELVRSSGKAIAYVSKYVAKAPAQFGKTRRYWVSRKWEVNPGDKPDREKQEPGSIRVVNERWTEVQERIVVQGLIPTVRPDGWIALQTLRQYREEHGDDRTPDLARAAFRSGVFLGECRRGMGLDPPMPTVRLMADDKTPSEAPR